MVEDAGRRRRVAALGAVLVLATSCSVDPTARTAPTDGPFPTATAPSVPVTGPATAVLPPTVGVDPGRPDLSSAQSAAKEWLTRYQSASWQDPLPSAWVARTRPVVTQKLALEYEQLLNGGGGASWAKLVSGKCTDTVAGVTATFPSEVPPSERSAVVLVTGTLVTNCPGVDQTSEPVAATVSVVLEADGLWRVAQRFN